MSAFWILLIIHILIISFRATDCIVPEWSLREHLPAISTDPDQKIAFYNRPAAIKTPEDLEKMYTDFGVRIIVQRELMKNNFDTRPVTVRDNAPKSSSADASGGGIDPWSIVWYIGSFGGLIAFFLVVSCSEWCCARNRNSNRTNGIQSSRNPPTGYQQQPVAGTPPPAYHLFAPPSYDTCSLDSEEKSTRFEVYVVPVHAVDIEFSERKKNTIEQRGRGHTADLTDENVENSQES